MSLLHPNPPPARLPFPSADPNRDDDDDDDEHDEEDDEEEDSDRALPWVPSPFRDQPNLTLPSQFDPHLYPSAHVALGPDDGDDGDDGEDDDDVPFVPRPPNTAPPPRFSGDQPPTTFSARSPSPSFSELYQYPHLPEGDDPDHSNPNSPHEDQARFAEAQHARTRTRERDRASQESDASQGPPRRKLPQSQSPSATSSFDPFRASPPSSHSAHPSYARSDPYSHSHSAHPPPVNYNAGRYPAYDEHNRRIGLEHLHHDAQPPRSSGSSAYYRPHTRDYPRLSPTIPSNGPSSAPAPSHHPQHVHDSRYRSDHVQERAPSSRQAGDYRQAGEHRGQPPNPPSQADSDPRSQPLPAAAARPPSGSPALYSLPPSSAPPPAPPPAPAPFAYSDTWEGEASPELDANGASITTDHLRHLLRVDGDVSIGLQALVDPPPGEKPNYPLPTLIKLAIYGSPRRKLTLQEIYTALEDRFVWFKENTHDMAWKNSIRHNLSLRKCFKRVQRPITEPGKGSYWMIDVTQGEGNKRQRKRNKKPTKAQLAAQQQNAQQVLTYQYNPLSSSYQFDPSSQPSQHRNVVDDGYDDYDDGIMATPRLHPVHPLPDAQAPAYHSASDTVIDPTLRNGAQASGTVRALGHPIAAHPPYPSSIPSSRSPLATSTSYPDLSSAQSRSSYPASSRLGVPQLPRAPSAGLKLPDLPPGPPPRQYGHHGLGLGHASNAHQPSPALSSHRSDSPRQSPFARDSRTPEYYTLPPINSFDRAPSTGTSSVSTGSPATSFSLPSTLGFGQHPNARTLGGPVRRPSTALELPEPVKKRTLHGVGEANGGGGRRPSKFVPPQKSQSSGSWLRELEGRQAEASEGEEEEEEEEEGGSDGGSH